MLYRFICQIRDEKSHIPLKGLEIGDIGPKYGYGTKDNGYIIFNQFKVSKDALLSRYTTITEDGNVHTVGDPKIAYSVMLQIRSNLLKYGWEGIFRILIIAGRYTNFRTQFKTFSFSKKERKLISYEATRNHLISYASLGYAIFFTWNFIKNNATDKLKDLHSLLSWLKAFFMNEVFDGIKTVREVCGAHAYLISSNISNMMEIWSPNVTLEGDGFVLYQQTTKDILKRLSKIMKGKESSGVYSYLNEILDFVQEPPKLTFSKNAKSLIEIIKAALLNQIIKTGELLRKKMACLLTKNGTKYIFLK